MHALATMACTNNLEFVANDLHRHKKRNGVDVAPVRMGNKHLRRPLTTAPRKQIIRQLFDSRTCVKYKVHLLRELHGEATGVATYPPAPATCRARPSNAL